MDTSFMIDSPECTDSPLEEDAFSNTKRNLLEDFACPTPMKASNVEPGEEHMKVFLRIRPFTEEETTSGENQGCMELENENLLTMHAPKDSVTFKNSTHGCGKTTHKFTFSKIFSDDVGQKAFFDDTMLSTVKDFVDGQNCLVFTYGITNAGKTYTIQGKPMDGGILPRALDVLFNSIENKQWESMTLKPKMFCDVVKLSERDLEHEQRVKDKVFRMASDEDPDVTTLLGDDASDMSRATNSTMASEESIMHSSSVDSGLDELDEAENRVREEMAIDVEAQGQIKFSVWVTFAEIYNEYIYDLLEPLPKKKNARRQVLTLREDKNGSPYVKGLKHIHVTSADEAYRILQIGRKNLQFACTKLNQNSSRSHCIFSIKVLRVVDKENPHMCRMSMLSLVDLAGSERYTKTQNTGDRLKEAGNINTSLLTLGRCISTLRYNQTHKENPKIIPFRESKLTRLFQSYFCGKGRACMIVNVNQLASAFDETLHVLKFSAIAKQVIVQKEEPKPKKSTLRNAARFVSLALQHSPTGARPSISWASPATIAQHSVEMAANLPIPEDDDEDLLESETEREETLKAIIAGLKEEMLAEKRKHALLEVQIREEVCQEMAEQLVEIENTYSERLKEGYLAAEEKADRRIEMYTQSVKSSRKRARIQRMDDEEDEWVSSVLLHAEQIKVKELENRLKDQTETLASVQAELASAQTSLKVAVDAKNGLQEEKSKGDFHMANEINELRKSHEKAMCELKADITRLEKEKTSFEEKFKALDSQKPAGGDDMSDLVQNEIISNLTQQLEDAKETIASQASQISDLSEMLNEAGETFDEKNAEIEKLKKSGAEDQERLQAQAAAVEELKKLLVESKKALEVAEVKLQQRDETMVDLRQTVDTQKECLDAKLQENVALHEKVEAFEETMKDLRTKLESAQKLAEEQIVNKGEEKSDSDLKDCIKSLEALVEKEKADHRETESKAVSLETCKTEVEGELKATAAELQVLKDERNNCLKEIELRSKKLEDTEVAIKSMEETLHELENELCEAQEKFGAQELSLKTTQERLEEEKCARRKAECDIVTVQDKVKELEDKLSTTMSSKKSEVEPRQPADNLSQLMSRVKQLEEEKNSLVIQLDTAANRADEMSFQVNEYKIEMEHMQGSETSPSREFVEKELRNDLSRVKAELSKEQQKFHSAKVEVSALENNVEQLQHDLKIKTQTIKDLEIKISHPNDENLKPKLSVSNRASDSATTGGELACIEQESEILLAGEIQELKQTLEKERQKLRAARVEISLLENTLQQRDHDLSVVKDKQMHLQKQPPRVSGWAQTEDIVTNENVCQQTTCEVSDEDMDVIFNKNVVLLGYEESKSTGNVAMGKHGPDSCGSSKVLDLQQEIDKLKEEVESLTQKAIAASERQAEMMKQVGLLEGQLSESRQECDRLKDKAHVGDSSSRERDSIDKLFEINSDALTPGKGQMHSRKKRTLKPKKHKLDGAEEKQEEIDLLMKQTEELKEEGKKSQQEETVSERKYKVIVEECNAEITALAHALKTAELSHEESEKRARVLENQVSQLESELETAKIRCVYLDSQVLKQEAPASENEADNLRMKIKDLENVISVDKMLCEEAKDRISIVETECERLQEELASAEEQKSLLEAQLKEAASGNCCEVFKSKVEELQECSDNLRKMLDETTNQVQSLSLAKSNTDESKKHLVEKCNGLEDTLKSKVMEMKECEDQLSSVKSAMEAKEIELTELKKRVDGDASKLSEKLMEVAGYTQKCNQLEDQLRMKDVFLEEQQKQISTMEAELSGARVDAATARQTENKQAGYVREHEEKIAELEKQVEELKQSIREMEEGDAELHKVKDALEKELKEDKEKLDKMTVICETLNVAKSDTDHELREMKVKLKKLESELLETHSHDQDVNGEYERELSDLKGKCSSLEALKDSLEKEVSSLVDVKRKCEAFELELKDKESSIEELKKQLADSICQKKEDGEKFDVKNKSMHDEIKSIQSSFALVKAEKAALETEVDLLKCEMKRMNCEIEAANSNKDDLVKSSNDNAQLQAELDKSKNKVEELEKELLKTKALVGQKELKLSELSEKLSMLNLTQQQMETLTDNLNKAQEREDDLRKKLHQASMVMDEQNQEYKQLQQKALASSDAAVTSDMAMKKLQQEVADYKKIADDYRSTLEEVKVQLSERESRHEVELRSIEEQLSSKEHKVTQLLTEMEMERKTFELALKDSKSNEKLLGDMKKALEEQEDCMDKQDKLLEVKDKAIQKLTTDMEAMTSVEDIQKLSADKSRLEEKLSKAEKSLGDLRRVHSESRSQDEYQKLLEEKQKLAAIVSENNSELKELEKLLSSTRHELETLKNSQDEELKKKLVASREDVNTQINNLKQEVVDKKADIRHLKKEKEEKAKQLRDFEVKVESLQQTVSSMEKSKAAELQEWRENRDQLVSSLEKVMQKKDEEIKELKASLANQPNQSSIMESGENEDLVKMLENKVASLEDQLLKESKGNQRTTRKTRGRAAAGSHSEEIDESKDLAELRHQLEREIQDHKQTSQQLERVLVARDENEADLREANQKLQVQLMALQQGEESGDRRTSRARKRRSHEMATNENVEPEPTSQQKRSTRGRKKKVHEDVIDEETPNDSFSRTSFARSSKRTLSKLGEMMHNSPLGKSAKKLMDSVKSPPRSPLSPSKSDAQVAPPTTGKKKRLLNKDAPVLLTVPPPFDLGPAEPESENVHSIVTRRLTRSRKK